MTRYETIAKAREQFIKRGYYVNDATLWVALDNAVDIVLEEAAKIVEGNAVEGASGLHRGRSGEIVWDPESAYGHGRFEAAKDIRALKGE